jgi:hypothetical protein
MNALRDVFCNVAEDSVLFGEGVDEPVFDLRFLQDGADTAGPGWSSRPSSNQPHDERNNRSTTTNNNIKTAEELVLDALNLLSLADRSRIEHELHGIESWASGAASDKNKHGVRDDETPDFQRRHLDRMDQELTRLRSERSWSLQLAALDMAESQNPGYIQNPEFRTQFLRSEYWDAPRAALRLALFLDLKLELFGEDKITRDIRLTDLQPPDIELLKLGYIQRLPARDRAGRLVLCSVYNGQTFYSPDSAARVFFYMVCAFDSETARRGVVMIDFKIRPVSFANEGDNPVYFSRAHRVLSNTCLPVRFCALHKFLPKEESHTVRSRITRLVDHSIGKISPTTRSRIRLHYGTYTEWMYELLCVGIPHPLVPFTIDLKLKTKNQMEYLSMRQKDEELKRHGSTIWTTDLPSNYDVLLGKGKPIQDSPGNRNLSAMIDERLFEYQAASKSEKTVLTSLVVQRVKDEFGGKFVSKDDAGVWVEASDGTARDKVSHLFRHRLQRATTITKKTNITTNNNKYNHGVPNNNIILGPSDKSCNSSRQPMMECSTANTTSKRIKV